MIFKSGYRPFTQRDQILYIVGIAELELAAMGVIHTLHGDQNAIHFAGFFYADLPGFAVFITRFYK
ncbi:MAG: hypothetical protein OEV78_02605 [Spirochaetia bacterium]|nr:hypothetical protein [Spirochaetia bacterium]